MLKKLAIMMLTAGLLISQLKVQAKEATVYVKETVEAEITCYYPDDSTMEGGYKNSRGEWLDVTEYVCAGPKCLPYGTLVALGDVNNWRSNHTYEIDDRGGAMIVDDNGVYHFDLLVSCEEVANNFGRQKCEVELKIPVGYQQD